MNIVHISSRHHRRRRGFHCPSSGDNYPRFAPTLDFSLEPGTDGVRVAAIWIDDTEGSVRENLSLPQLGPQLDSLLPSLAA